MVYKWYENISASSKGQSHANAWLVEEILKVFVEGLILFLYWTYIRPHLECCAPSWSPYLAKDIYSLKQIQHHATKLVKSLSTLPYEDRPVSLQLQSLYCCRQHGDLFETFKIWIILQMFNWELCLPWTLLNWLEVIPKWNFPKMDIT